MYFGSWKFVKSLGQGAFGKVDLFINDESGRAIAAKSLKNNPKLKPDEINILQKRWRQEYFWMQNLRTHNIVGAADIKDGEFLNFLGDYYKMNTQSLPVIVMDYCNGGDLRSHLNGIVNMNGFKEYEVRNILNAILYAVKYLHEECNIEHRDIKPENIVSHIQGNKRIYKTCIFPTPLIKFHLLGSFRSDSIHKNHLLADFGYAREIPESTISQSVVGTSNYVAPEVIDPGVYTKSVDYWSIGILAYEIICGTYPFMSHQTLLNRISSIQLKGKECITIAENVDEDKFDFLNMINAKNHSSPIFVKCMEDWLRLALDKDYKTRGCNNPNELKIYTDFENISKQKIVTVFSLKNFRKYYYDMEKEKNLEEFSLKICFENQISKENLFFIYPPLHPHKNPRSHLDVFVSEWCCSNSDNPPVMLFVGEFLIKKDLRHIDVVKHFDLSETFMKCYQKEHMPLWMLQQYEKEVHFILTNEQNLLECYVMGLNNYIIEIEHQVFKYEDELERLHMKIAELSGSVKLSYVIFQEFINSRNVQTFKPSVDMAKIQELYSNEAILKNTYKEIVQNCRTLARDKIFDQYAKGDIYELTNYRKSLSLDYPHEERLVNAKRAFEKCTREFTKFISSKNWDCIRNDIRNQLDTFNNLQQNVMAANQIVKKFESEIIEQARSMLRHDMSMNSLHIDGIVTNTSILSDHITLNIHDETVPLINECESIMSDLMTSMHLD